MTYTAAERNRAAQAARHRRYELMRLHGIPTSLVPSAEAAARVRKLYDLGWSYDALADMTGGVVTNQAIRLLAIDSHPTAQRRTHNAVMRLPYTLAPTDQVPDTCKVPSLGAVRRARALLRLGWTHADMRRRAGVDTTHVVTAEYRQMVARKWRAIATLYDELCMTPGPSPIAAIHARTQLFFAPLAWDDIDDPDERPQRNPYENVKAHGLVDRAVVTRLLAGERVPSTKAEKVEALRRWTADGKSIASLCSLHGWNEARYVDRGEPEQDQEPAA